MEKLIEWWSAERGRKMRLAAACGVTHGAISQWDRVPDNRLSEVSRITGIPPHELRPDLADIFRPKQEAEG
jgi:pyruvate kinase